MRSGDEIKIGDWVTGYFAGYWQVVDIKPNYVNREISNLLFVIKKGFTPKMKFNVALQYCDVKWCKKVSEEKRKEISDYFEAHPNEKKKFDTYEKPIIGECMSWRINLPDDKIEEYNALLKELPVNFTVRQFNRFVEKIGLRKFMKGMASPGKYML